MTKLEQAKIKPINEYSDNNQRILRARGVWDPLSLKRAIALTGLPEQLIKHKLAVANIKIFWDKTSKAQDHQEPRKGVSTCYMVSKDALIDLVKRLRNGPFLRLQQQVQRAKALEVEDSSAQGPSSSVASVELVAPLVSSPSKRKQPSIIEPTLPAARGIVYESLSSFMTPHKGPKKTIKRLTDEESHALAKAHLPTPNKKKRPSNLFRPTSSAGHGICR